MSKIHFTESFKPWRKNDNVDNIFVKEPQTLEEADVEDCLSNAATVLNLHRGIDCVKGAITHIPAVLRVEVWMGLWRMAFS